MLFLKALKSLALATGTFALGLCAMGVGIVFNGLLRSLAYSPDSEEGLFGYTMIGFALVETFAVLALAVIGLVYVL